MNDAPSGAGGSHQTGLKLLVGCGCLTILLGGAGLFAAGLWTLSRPEVWDEVAGGPPPPPKVAQPEAAPFAPPALAPPKRVRRPALVDPPDDPPAARQGGPRKFTLEDARAVIPEAASVPERDSAGYAKGVSAAQFMWAAKEDFRLALALTLLFPDKWPDDLTQIPPANALEKARPHLRGMDRFGIFEPRHIVSVTSPARGDFARGVFTFKTAFYKGRAEFTARWVVDRWVVESFRFPDSGLTLVRNELGLWRRADLPPSSPPFAPPLGKRK